MNADKREIIRQALVGQSAENEETVDRFLGSVPGRYIAAVSPTDAAVHFGLVASLSPETPAVCAVSRLSDDRVSVCVAAFDVLFGFSSITGLLGASGFSISSGEAHTLARAVAGPSGRGFKPSAVGRYRRKVAQTADKIILDIFEGSLSRDISMVYFSGQLEKELTSVFKLLHSGNEEDVLAAKRMVNEKAVGILPRDSETAHVLLPVEITVDNDSGVLTRMSVTAQDTSLFLYTLSTAFSLNNIVIDQVQVKTREGRVEDRFYLADSRGGKIEGEEKINRLKLSVLLTKEFAFHLHHAPDPFAALQRFELFCSSLAQSKSQDVLKDPDRFEDLAALFGSSDVLFEDLLRTQYEELLPLLETTGQIDHLERIPGEFARRVSAAGRYEEKVRELNRLKDHYIFQLDYKHIVNGRKDFMNFSQELTFLAEIVLYNACEVVYSSLIEKYGVPVTASGLPARYALMGLGKLGGAALGYASDIEIMLVYNDAGKTNGPESIENTRFFDYFVMKLKKTIHAKRQGIFELDLRLRPHGSDGPLSVSLDNFCKYYGQNGAAYAYERLALVRLRYICGDEEFGSRVERLGDNMVYESNAVSIKELQELRARQAGELTGKKKLNMKLSPGCLVDIEYSVQILQVIHGGNIQSLRTPRVSRAIHELKKAGVLSDDEEKAVISSYEFFRNIINGLRMLRGNAKDLELPGRNSFELLHLAKRSGYDAASGDPGRRLYRDVEEASAVVRSFLHSHTTLLSETASWFVNPADIALNECLDEKKAGQILSPFGFRDVDAVFGLFRRLCRKVQLEKEILARLILLLCDFASDTPDPDAAVKSLERYMEAAGEDPQQYLLLLNQTARLEILLQLGSISRYAVDILVNNPEYFDWLTNPEVIERPVSKKECAATIKKAYSKYGTGEKWYDEIRKIKQKETLRIIIKDMIHNNSLESIVSQISILAEVLSGAVLDVLTDNMARNKLSLDSKQTNIIRRSFCLFAFGKLGGSELNYSSDIDLLGLYRESGELETILGDAGSSPQVFYSAVLDGLHKALSRVTSRHHVYRVDYRLRPYGQSGILVPEESSVYTYYEKKSRLWELQALLKLRPIAGNTRAGAQIVERLRYIIRQSIPGEEEIARSIEGARQKALVVYKTDNFDIKNSRGGIRDVEFIIQFLQLTHLNYQGRVIESNSMLAMDLLRQKQILDKESADTLTRAYVFLRKIEHYLQIHDDRQTHLLKMEHEELQKMAVCISGPGTDEGSFLEQLESITTSVRDIYSRCILAPIKEA